MFTLSQRIVEVPYYILEISKMPKVPQRLIRSTSLIKMVNNTTNNSDSFGKTVSHKDADDYNDYSEQLIH